MVQLTCLSTAGALLAAFTSGGLAGALPNQQVHEVDNVERLTLSEYAPVPVACPTSGKPLVRPATGVNAAEASFVATRKIAADAALKKFLKHTGAGFNTSSDKYPTIGLTSSGGGLRALLTGAGVHQAFDERDSNVSTRGLYQAFTYEAGLSGGAWLLSSISANNWPTISSLKVNLWQQAFMDSLLDPDTLFASLAYPAIVDDLAAKVAAGYEISIVDAYGRLLSYQLLYGADGGVADQISNLPNLANFTSHKVPFPILTALGDTAHQGTCLPPENATQYEFSPYEFGSWDKGIHAFSQIKYLGSDLTNGKPTVPGKCITNFDNQGFILGTSSDVFNGFCLLTFPNNTLPGALQQIVEDVQEETAAGTFAYYPNPFKGYTSESPKVAHATELMLSDGGEANQNNPIWPFLYRPSVNVLVVNDNSADTSDNYPNGTELLTTYQRAMQVGVGYRMPKIPSVETFVSQGLNKRPTFFGCNSNAADQLTILWLPNTNYTFNSGQSTFRIQYDVADTDAMISNGELVASYNNSKDFPTCLACGIMKKEPDAQPLPKACAECFKKFCYN